MSKLFALIRRDLSHVRGNAIALLVFMGLVVMPSFYAWFNIAGGWDPYGNTGQVKVALANSDQGVKGSVIPFDVNVGERVVSSLAGSDKIGYVVTDEDDAIEGVRSGEYYAAVVIPKNFSSNLLSVLTKSPTHPQLEYYVNEKRNAIASIVTGKASGSVQTMVDKGFTESVTEVVTELFDQVSLAVDKSDVPGIGQNLDTQLDYTLAALERSASDLESYREVIVSIEGVMASSSAIFDTSSSSLDFADSLSGAADGVRTLDGVAARAKDSAGSAIDTGRDAMADVEAALDDAFDVADDKADQLGDALLEANQKAKDKRDALNDFLDSLKRLDERVASLNTEFEVGSVDAKTMSSVDVNLSDTIARTQLALSYLNELIDSTDRAVADIQTSKEDGQASRQELKGMVADASAGIESVRTAYEDKLSGSLDEVANTIDGAAAKAAGISDTLRDESGKLTTAISDATDGLRRLEGSLDAAAGKLEGVATKLEGLRDRLRGALSAGDTDLIRSILGGDAASLVSFAASPVELDRKPYYAVENNGSAMTPFYTTMALWVGGTLIGLLVYVGVSKRAIDETGASPRHAYFARLAIFLGIGALQSTVLMLGDLFFLEVQCQDPVRFLLTGWLASTVFLNIIYSLATSFGDAGKAVAVFIMVLQVAGSGGTFPVQMLPTLFQRAYPFLPFVHSENAFRAAMFGSYGNDWLTSMGTLAAFLVPALLLGLVLRKPFVPVTEWIEEKMEETKLM